MVTNCSRHGILTILIECVMSPLMLVTSCLLLGNQFLYRWPSVLIELELKLTQVNNKMKRKIWSSSITQLLTSHIVCKLLRHQCNDWRIFITLQIALLSAPQWKIKAYLWTGSAQNRTVKQRERFGKAAYANFYIESLNTVSWQLTILNVCELVANSYEFIQSHLYVFKQSAYSLR